MKVDLSEIAKRVEAGHVATQKHPSLDLLIHNYTPRCQYEYAWDEWTLRCRGLITDGNGNVIVRPFEKFFNADESLPDPDRKKYTPPPLPLGEPFDVYEKLDGSLGLLYRDADGHYSLATRGSFTSPQAIKGTEILRRKYAGVGFATARYSYLFEILYPNNRIVVDYGDLEDVVLLAAIDNEDGSEIGPQEAVIYVHDQQRHPGNIGMSVVKRYDGVADFSALKGMIADDKEGYVVRFRDSGVRCKIKGEEYKRLHKVLTGVSTKSIWELLSEDKPVTELLDRVPDEFVAFVRKTESNLRKQYYDKESEARRLLGEVKDTVDGVLRRDWALRIIEAGKENGLTPIMFQMLDGKPYAKSIWKTLRPAYAKPYHVDPDA